MYQYIYYITADTQDKTNFGLRLYEAYDSIAKKELHITNETTEKDIKQKLELISWHIGREQDTQVTSYYIGKTFLEARKKKDTIIILNIDDSTTFNRSTGLYQRWHDAKDATDRGPYNKLFVIAVIKEEWVPTQYKRQDGNITLQEDYALSLEQQLIKQCNLLNKKIDNKAEQGEHRGRPTDSGKPVFLVYLCVNYSDFLPITHASEERMKKLLKAQKALIEAQTAITEAMTKKMTKKITEEQKGFSETQRALTQEITQEMTEAQKAVSKAVSKVVTKAMTEAMTEPMSKSQKAITETQKALFKAMTEGITKEMIEEMTEEITKTQKAVQELMIQREAMQKEAMKKEAMKKEAMKKEKQ